MKAVITTISKDEQRCEGMLWLETPYIQVPKNDHLQTKITK